MAINTFEYAKLLQNKLDQHMIATSATGWMESNAGQVIYKGGNEVKIPSMTTTGLKNYDRDSGYKQGAITTTYKTYTMTQDRGTVFHIDAMDVDETGFIVNAANVTKEFQDRHVIPEVDAYRLSKISAVAKTANQSKNYTVDEATILAELKEGIRAVQDYVDGTPVRIILTSKVLGALENSPKWDRTVQVDNFTQGNLNFQVKSIDGNRIQTVPSARMFSQILVKDGETSGQEAGGYEKAVGAQDINFLIVAENAPIAISKTDLLRIFDPLTNQDANAWKIDYRKYHDLWIKKSMEKAIYANLKPGA